jgi:hypothetical protein
VNERNERQVAAARLLVSRLERLSADSYWAHQASGLRGSLLRHLQQIEPTPAMNGFEPESQAGDWQRLDDLVERGFEILALAARALRRPSLRSRKP